MKVSASHSLIATLCLLGSGLVASSTAWALGSGDPGAKPGMGAWFETWLHGQSALGEWGGLRQTLEDSGLTVSGSSVTAILGNLSGGKRQSWVPANTTLLAADLDFGKLTDWPGFALRVEGWAAGGSNLSAGGRIDNLFMAASAYTPPGLYLGQLYLQQRLFDDTLKLLMGRLITTSDFASLPIASAYVNGAINAAPINLVLNTVPFTNPPATQWAAVGKFTPAPQIALSAGVYNANSRASKLKGTGGVDFDLDLHDGVMAIGQLAYLHENGELDTGLPGTYYLGAFYAGDSYSYVNSGSRNENTQEKIGNYGFYLEGQQMLYRPDGAGTSRGLTAWFAFALQPDQDINKMPSMGAIGASYEGLFKDRPMDQAAFAVYRGNLSRDIKGATAETLLEINYSFVTTPWLTITPDIQYIFNPDGKTDRKDVVVIGSQFVVDF